MGHGFEYRVKAIPTEYNGILYRSRLEAWWACYFHTLGWEYIYEPFDLDGWIPDFLIKGPTDVLVEVKPFYKKEHFQIEADNILRRHPSYEGDILLVGSTTDRINSDEAPEAYKGYWDTYDKKYDLSCYCKSSETVILGWLASNQSRLDFEEPYARRKPIFDLPFESSILNAAILGYHDNKEFDFCRYDDSSYWSTVRRPEYIRSAASTFEKMTHAEDLYVSRLSNKSTQYQPRK